MNPIDMDPSHLRVCLCNCNTGRFVTSISRTQIEYLHQLVTAKVRAANSPEEIDSEALEVIEVILDLEADFDIDRDQ